MGFEHPSMQAHKLRGMAKAAQSPNTPAHLRAHLQKKVGTMARVDNLHKPSGRVPKQQVLRSDAAPEIRETEPQDPEAFETQGNDIAPMGTKMGATSRQPSPAGTRPMNVSASLPRAKAPGLGGVNAARVPKPKGNGLNKNLGAVSRPNSSRNVPRVNSVVRKGESGPGIQKTASQQKTRNMRGPGANPNFYGDF